MDRFVREITRIPTTLCAAAGELPATTLYEANGRRGALDPAIRQVTPGLSLVGSALTVRCEPGDNLTLHAAVAWAEPGDVIVADAGGLADAGHWGEILAVAALARGVAGLVIAGGVRDVAELTRRRFPVYAGGVSMKATGKVIPGLVNHPIRCGGVAVEPGDLVRGDEDGVVVIGRAEAAAVIERARRREAAEAGMMRRLESGELTIDLLGLRDKLAGTPGWPGAAPTLVRTDQPR